MRIFLRDIIIDDRPNPMARMTIKWNQINKFDDSDEKERESFSFLRVLFVWIYANMFFLPISKNFVVGYSCLKICYYENS